MRTALLIALVATMTVAMADSQSGWTPIYNDQGSTGNAQQDKENANNAPAYSIHDGTGSGVTYYVDKSDNYIGHSQDDR